MGRVPRLARTEAEMGLFVPSGARVTKATPPNALENLTLADGRVLVCVVKMDTLQDPQPGQVITGARWSGPDNLTVVATFDMTDAWGPLMHVSISYPDHDPDWKTITLVKDALFGDVDAMMILPKAEDYIHGVPGWEDSTVFQLWQTPQRWGIR